VAARNHRGHCLARTRRPLRAPTANSRSSRHREAGPSRGRRWREVPPRHRETLDLVSSRAINGK
jgi:hypothetical protein